MEFRLLGELEVRAAHRPLDVGLPRQQAVLAALLVDAGRPVPAATLIDRAWGESPPTQVRNVLYSHLSRIRRLLVEGAATAGETPPRVERRPAGYLLMVDPETVDLHRFRRLAEQSRDRRCALAEQVVMLRKALDLWRGTPLAGIPGDWAAGVRDSYRQQRLDVAIRWAQATLRLGHHDSVLAELPELAAEYPLVEPLEGLLMQALHAAGRDAEAVDRFAGVRQRLVAALGVEPGAELQSLHQALLSGDLPAARLTSVPAQLPADVSGFTGRREELDELDSLLTTAGDQQPTLVISAVSGTAGIGKTALAVRWAHRVANRFPDGQLYVNLRGYDPGRPLSPGTALSGFLTALGVSGHDIPLELDDRAARYRTEISGRRMLIVLDNAGSVEQVRPLLPGSSSCVTLVTSRDSLAGLVALHGGTRVHLDLLPPADAIALLRRLIGRRAEAEPEATVTLAGQCGRLPLALRVAAELAVTRPSRTLSELVGELTDHQRRLDLLDVGGDPRGAVRVVFSWSYQHLSSDVGRMFRLLGLHPGADHDSRAAAALVGTADDVARRLLDELVRAHLVQQTSLDRYTMHDLLGAYATRLAVLEDSETDRQAALTRLFDYYLDRATPAVEAPVTAAAWLDAERLVLVAVCAYAASNGWPTHATRLAATLYRYLNLRAHHADAIEIHGHALTAARRQGDRSAEAGALTNLGTALRNVGRNAEALDLLNQALTIRRHEGNRKGEADALNTLAIINWRMGRYRETLDWQQQSLAIRQDIGDRSGEATVLGNMGVTYWLLGRYPDALEHYTRALALHRETDDREAAAGVLNNIGLVYVRWGRHAEALDHLQSALELARDSGDRMVEAETLVSLGVANLRQGRFGDAEAYLDQASTLAQETGYRALEAETLNNFGRIRQQQKCWREAERFHEQSLALAREINDQGLETESLTCLGHLRRATGELDEAILQYESALNLARGTGDSYEQAQALDGIARSEELAGQSQNAVEHWRQALAIYDRLGVPDADNVREHLATLSQ